MIKELRADFEKLAASNAEIDKLKKQLVIMRGEAKIQGQQVKVTSKHLGDLAETVDELSATSMGMLTIHTPKFID